VSFASPRIERGAIVFDGEAGDSGSAVFTAAARDPSRPASGFVIRAATWASDDGFVSVYGGSGNGEAIVFIGVGTNTSGLYIKQLSSPAAAARARLIVGSGEALPGIPGRVISPAVGRGLRDVDTSPDTAGDIAFVSLTNMSFGVFVASAGTAAQPSTTVRAVAVNGSTLLPGCQSDHGTIGAVGNAPALARGGSAAAFYAGNGEMQTEPTACEGIYSWCKECHPALAVVASTQEHSAAPASGRGNATCGGTFTAFGQSSIAASVGHAGVDIAFYANSRTSTGDAVRRGVYLQPAATGAGMADRQQPRQLLRRVADTTMTAPLARLLRDGTAASRSFTSFDAVSVHSGVVVFRAEVEGKQGVYMQDRSGSLHVIADAHTAAPPPFAKPGWTFQYVELSQRAFDGRGVVFYALVGADEDARNDDTASAMRPKNSTGSSAAFSRPGSGSGATSTSNRGLWYADISRIIAGA